MATISAERRLKKATISCMRREEFALMSGILMIGNATVDENFPTAFTNGRDVTYGRKFIDKITDNAVSFVVLHEALHKMCRHLSTYERLFKEDPQLTNAACDYWVNQTIMDMDPDHKYTELPVIDGQTLGLLDSRFKGMSIKQIFDILKQEQQKGGGKGKGQGGGDGFDEHDWGGAEDMTDQEKQELAQEIDQAIRQGKLAQQKLAGKGNGGLDRALDELLEPKVDWREVLREFVTSTCANKDTSSWRRVNRRFIGQDIYFPTLIGEAVGRLGLGVDMSGSTWVGNMFRDFMSETVGICKTVQPEAVDLLYWDCHIAGHEEYTQGTYDSMASTTLPKGGGGTHPQCVPDWYKEHKVKPQAIVMLTDGYVDNWGHDWPCPVLWVIVGNKSITAPNGITIHLDESM